MAQGYSFEIITDVRWNQGLRALTHQKHDENMHLNRPNGII